MIFVAVGTQKFQLNRLLRAFDNLIESGKLTEEVFAQTGYSDYIPQNYNYKSFLDKEEFEQKIVKCSLLVTHSGVGTIMAGLKNRKPVVIFPRKVEYYEHVDNHQLEIAEAFAKKNYVFLCDDEGKLYSLMHEALEHNFDVYSSGQKDIVKKIKCFLEEI